VVVLHPSRLHLRDRHGLNDRPRPRGENPHFPLFNACTCQFGPVAQTPVGDNDLPLLICRIC
jgi:hypothetical protein